MNTKISVSSVLTLQNSLISNKGEGETVDDSFAMIYFCVRTGDRDYINIKRKDRREKWTIW